MGQIVSGIVPNHRRIDRDHDKNPGAREHDGKCKAKGACNVIAHRHPRMRRGGIGWKRRHQRGTLYEGWTGGKMRLQGSLELSGRFKNLPCRPESRGSRNLLM